MRSSSSFLTDCSLVVDGRIRRAVVRTASFVLTKRERRRIVRSVQRHRVWPIFVFAAAFGIVTALLTRPVHEVQRDARLHANATELLRTLPATSTR